jgi:molybdopterin-guanine dinucleotide biosynthesis protein A
MYMRAWRMALCFVSYDSHDERIRAVRVEIVHDTRPGGPRRLNGIAAAFRTGQG